MEKLIYTSSKNKENEKNHLESLEILEKDYQPIVYEQSFGLKNKIKLFKDGFKGGAKGLFSLFVSYVLWMFVFVFFGMGLEYLFNSFWYIFNGKEFLQTETLKDYLVAFQIFFFMALTYNSQQLFTLNNLMKLEKVHDKNNFILFLKQTPMLVAQTIILSGVILVLMFLLGLYLIYISKTIGEFRINNFHSILFILLGLSSISFIYFVMLGNIFVFTSSYLKPLKINFFKKTYRAIKKTIKMFGLITPMLMLHLLILVVVLTGVAFVGEQAYEYYKTKYMVENSLEENLMTFFTTIFIALPLFGLFQTYFNRARLRSLVLMFLLTEEQDEYNNRLTKPMKK